MLKRKDLLEVMTPESIEQAKDTLKAYSSVYVFEHRDTKENKVSTSVGISSSDCPWRYIGTLNVDDVFTLEERRLNYKEVFGYKAPF